MFECYSPQDLRDGIEIELRTTIDPVAAAQIAMSRLKEDPEYYHNMNKARQTKYIKRIPKTGGGYKYIYKEEKKNNNSKNIKLKMRFNAHELIHEYERIGYSERIGYEKTSTKALTKAKEFENNISEYYKEHTLILDENGNVLVNKIGDSEEINLEKEYKVIRGAEILTHTHPEDKSFSVEDVFLSLSLGIKELRVKTPKNTYYFKISHKRESENKNVLHNKNRNFMNTIININDKLVSHYRKVVPKGFISQSDAEKEHRKLLWETISKTPTLSDDFNIEYGEIRNEY